jgi:hypothetical protein
LHRQYRIVSSSMPAANRRMSSRQATLIASPP